VTGFEGAIFDVDGVLVDSPHEIAWRESLRELMEGDWAAELAGRTTWTADGFTSEVYQRELSGKPRMDGAMSALKYFGVPDLDVRAGEYAERKQAMVLRLIEEGRFTAFPDALRFVLAVKRAGLRLAAASSSKNAPLMLRQIRMDGRGIGEAYADPELTLAELFDADISGRPVPNGKPAPDIFLAAAAELGLPPERCFVVEDAPSGVRAAKSGGMAALGIARADDQPLLAAEHADLVVTSLDQVDLTALSRGELS
jgi:HAD superfamily hydrolase (TIGR01509 family)